MKKDSIIVVFLWVFFCAKFYLAYPQVTSASKKVETKSYDVNKDGRPDVTYYSDGKYIAKAEADTNYDGKPDVVVYAKDGKFESAEVDTNYDGKTDKKLSDVKTFNSWLNENHPDFNDKLNRADWEVKLLKF